MPLLIDTFNVLHTTGVLPPEQAGIDVDDLIGLLAVSRYRHQPITLICDGSGQDHDDPGCCGGVQVRYSGSGRPADDLIIDRINRDSAPRRLLVVSSDQEIVRAARRRKCRTMKSDTLLHHLAVDLERAAHPRPGPARPKIVAPLPRSEVQRWIEAFELGDPEQELAAAAPPPDPPPPPEGDPATQSTAAMDDQTSVTPTADPVEARAALPDDLVAEAEELADQEPDVELAEPELPPGSVEQQKQVPSRHDRDDDHAPDPMADVAARYEDADAGRRTARRLTRKQLAELTEDDLDAIDMQHLLPDVAPIDDAREQEDDDDPS